MLKLLRSLLPGTAPADAAALPTEAPTHIESPVAPPFPLAQHLADANGLPVLDWAAVTQWVNTIADGPAQAQAWSACELGWLQHFRAALGPSYRLRQQGEAVLVSSLPDNVARATLDFMTRTQQRVLRVLDGLAHLPEWGHDILVVFDDADTYYRYVAHYYPDAGEFAASSGMYLHHGCGHFLTVRADLRMIEPVIAHELTHACLSHLPIPAWLNEGLAVNTEHRLSPPPRPDATPQQMHARHRRFWGPPEMQAFWSGQSFLRPDEGNERPQGRASAQPAPRGGQADLGRPCVCLSCPTTWRASSWRNWPPTGHASYPLCRPPRSTTPAPRPPSSIWACRWANWRVRCWKASPVRTGSHNRRCGRKRPSGGRFMLPAGFEPRGVRSAQAFVSHAAELPHSGH